MADGIVKAGWLQRQSSILKRWKKRWFVLYQNGHLACFHGDGGGDPEGEINIPGFLIGLHAGKEVDVRPPDGHTNDSLMKLMFSGNDSKDLVLCAENIDDMKAWQISLEGLRVTYNQQGVNQAMPVTYNQQGVNQAMPVNYVNPTGQVITPGVGYGTTTTTVMYPGPYPYGGSYGEYPGQVLSYPGQVITTSPASPYVVPGAGCSNSTVVIPSAMNQVIIDDNWGGRYRHDRYHRRYHGYSGSTVMMGPSIFW